MISKQHNTSILDSFEQLIENGSCLDIRNFVGKHPKIRETKWRDYQPWIMFAIAYKRIEVVELLIELGFSPNEDNGPPAFTTPLISALTFDSLSVVQKLLEAGAETDGDPRYIRYPIDAVTNTKHALDYIKLLEKHGCNLDRDYMHNGTRKLVNALSMAEVWGQDDVVKYLRSKGYKTPEEKALLQPTSVPIASGLTMSRQIIDHLTGTIGAPEQLSLIQIVPTGIPVAVHAIAANEHHPYVTLFTTGMSEQPMTVPDGAEEYSRAELYIQLPADWKYRDYEDPNWGWPQHWLRSMAQYPQQHNTWLGGPVTLVANEDPPQPLAPNTKFTTLLLLADQSLVTDDGKKIWLYRMTPLYTEERQLEIDHGIPALLNAFDAHDIPMIVDMNRKNVGLQ